VAETHPGRGRILRSIAQAGRASARRWRWRLFQRPRSATIAQIKDRKAQRQRTDQHYRDDPAVSIIVQSFNQVHNVPTLESRLRKTCADELIVCEDGSLDGSHEAWLRRLVRPNDFLLHSNDIHEIRAYDRAIAFARGDIICLMQDDDRPPRDGSWLADALEMFASYPTLGVLGGWCGFDDYFEVEYNAPWLPAGLRRIPSVDPYTGLPLMFVENVNIGPYLLRKRLYDQLGGFDLSFSPPGEPGITFEAEFCYRTWREGYQVALTNIPVKLRAGEQSYILPGGTSLWGNDTRIRNERANKQRIAELYGRDLSLIREDVRKANCGLSAAVEP
jgi:glycosyltransferase involved in cell wall biosynthesis